MQKSKCSKKIFAGILYMMTGLLIFVISLIGFSAHWALTNWGDLDLDEIIFQVQSPLEGTGNGMIKDFILKALLPVLGILLVYILLVILLKRGKRRIICSLVFLVGVVVAGYFVKNMIWQRLDMATWIEGQVEQSDFIQENYVNPGDVTLTFPEEKRNLIYIYLESVETTFADQQSGGEFEQNTIPELTRIAQENEDFSGTNAALNGGIVYPGTGFTTGAIFAQTTGLPLKVSIGGNNMDTQESFFPEVIALGDILAGQGYKQVFVLGSDATFGGRRLYFTQHGGYEIRDYIYGQENGWIDPSYKVWWGFEDEILFQNAKDTLQELAAEDEPFNLTLLTVDTHFEDGYFCRLCGNEFGDNQYANVMACSSRQVAEFLEWIQLQDFYENTTIVISGDHTTMDTDFCDDVDPDYLRKTYTVYINPAAEVELFGKARQYSSFDNFPSTLAAMGVDIEGDRLGLGTNLFSSIETLTEEYGLEYLQKELSRKSEFLASLEQVDDENSEALLKRYREYMKKALTFDAYDAEKKELLVRVSENTSSGIGVDHFEVEYQELGKEKVNVAELERDPENSTNHIGTIDLSGWNAPIGEVHVNLYSSNGNTYNDVASGFVNYELGDKSDFIGYFQSLSEHPEYAVFLAICDEGTQGLNYEMMQAMWGIGLQTYLPGANRISYLAIVEDGNAIEMNGYEPLHYEGVLENCDVEYVVESAGYYSGSYASIVLDGEEYAVGTRGINVVVYDKQSRQVIDSTCFDTYLPQEEW